MTATRVAMSEAGHKSPWVKICDLFVDLPHSVYRCILSGATARQYDDGQAIFRVGDPANEILLLTHGRAKITQLERNGTEVILRLVVPGEIIGRPILEKGDVCSSTAQVIEVCRVVAWGRVAFDALLDKYPVLLRNATGILARQLSDLQGRFCELSTEMAAPRLAGAIVRLISQMGQSVSHSQEINITQQFLAHMIATDVWTVNRVLSHWERQGLVSLRRKTIVIQNYERLLDVRMCA